MKSPPGALVAAARLPWGVGCRSQSLPQQPCPSGGVWVQLPSQQGVSSVALERSSAHQLVNAPAPQPRYPLVVEARMPQRWRISNGLMTCDVNEQGLVALQGHDGVEQLAGPLRLCRYRDRGEFWDAWDLAADYRQQPLPVHALGPPELREAGPLSVLLVQRFQLGTSELRLDLRFRADCPWLELIASVDWKQRHELLRLELDLAKGAVRFAADTSGGVIERPAQARTAPERERWEVPVVSWLASQAAAPGGGLAVLLDGAQGVDAAADRLGVSLLRGPTWPDPGADAGRHRFRFALLPLQGGWAQAGVPQAAIASGAGMAGPDGRGCIAPVDATPSTSSSVPLPSSPGTRGCWSRCSTPGRHDVAGDRRWLDSGT